MTQQSTLFGEDAEANDNFFELGNDPDEGVDREFETYGPRSNTPITALSGETDAVVDVGGAVDKRRAESYGLSVGQGVEDVSQEEPPRRFQDNRGDSAPDAFDLPDEIGQDLASEQEPSGWRPRSARPKTVSTDIQRAMANGRYLRDVDPAPNSPSSRGPKGQFVGNEFEDAGVERRTNNGLFR